MPLSAAQAKIIAKAEAKILDKINDAKTNGGTFLQQAKKATIGGQPIATRVGGLKGGLNLGSLTDSLGGLVDAVQQAGDIATLVKNPMSLVQTAVSGAISDVTSKLTDKLTGQITGGQLSSLTTKLSSLNGALTNFEAHTSNLSGLSSAIDDAVPDFKKIADIGESMKVFGSDTVPDFISSTASALKSGPELTDIKDTLAVTIQTKMDQILQLDANTAGGQTAIAAIVTDVETLLNNQANVLTGIITFDTDNFNESSNNVTASLDVLGLSEQFSDPTSVSYALLVDTGVAKDSTITKFNAANKVAARKRATGV